MGVSISYMGTKRELATAVSTVIENAQPGIMLDVFAGMCSVGEAVAPNRPVWANDVQLFAAEVAKALFTSQFSPLRALSIADLYFEIFQTSFSSLTGFFAPSLALEDDLLAASSFAEFEKSYLEFKASLEVDQRRFTRQSHSLFTELYSDSYFGLRQAIAIDSIVYAVDHVHKTESGNSDYKRWLLIALGRSILRISNSTGHFAQFLKPKIGSFRKFQSQRKRDIWTEWLASNDEMEPVFTADWRARNKVFNEDTLDLVPRLQLMPDRPSVVYADPPYTNDQYSRYYHLLETLMLYDYPATSGAGLYRPNRFSTSFSLKRHAGSALKVLIESVAKSGADFVLSYPTNGLAYSAGVEPDAIMAMHFRKVERCYAITHNHSTFGASKGDAKSSVIEQIYIGRS